MHNRMHADTHQKHQPKSIAVVQAPPLIKKKKNKHILIQFVGRRRACRF